MTQPKPKQGKQARQVVYKTNKPGFDVMLKLTQKFKLVDKGAHMYISPQPSSTPINAGFPNI